MQPKTYRKSVRSALLIVLLVTLVLAIPEVAHAYASYMPPPAPTDPLNLCEGDGGDYTGFTRRIVACVQNTIITAVFAILQPTALVFDKVLKGCMTLAVAFWGIQMATGQRGWQARQGMILAFKLSFIMTMFWLINGFVFFYGISLQFMGEVLGAVTNYVNFSQSLSCDIVPPSDPSLAVWDHVDCTINTLIGGIFSGSDVSLGIGGFLLAALLSGGAGMFIALLGFLVVIQVLFAIIRALYIYILAYVGFSLMALVSPIFLPMILFRSTQGYFEKWFKLSLGFILQPIFLFVYLGMLLAAYDVVVYTGSSSFYNVLTGSSSADGTVTGGGFTGGCQPATCAGTCGPTSCPLIGPWLISAKGTNPKTGVEELVYQEKKYGDLSVNYNTDFATGKKPDTCPLPPDTCDSPPVKVNETGLANTVPEVGTKPSTWANIGNSLQSSVYKELKIDDYFFHVSVPMEVVNWDVLASANGSTDTQTFFTNLFMSLFMAMATTYIFLLLLDMLPFIGSGVANIGSFMSGGSGMSGFGFGGLAPPGAGLVNNLRKKITGG